jgi:hypothetical protein
MSDDFPKKKWKGLGRPSPPPLLPPLDRPARPLGNLLGKQLEEVLEQLDDVLGDAWDGTYGLEDVGRQPLLRQRITRTLKAVTLLVRRLQADLTALADSQAA